MVPIGPGRRAAFNAELAPAETDDHSNPQRGLAGLLSTHQDISGALNFPLPGSAYDNTGVS